jgi:MFS family permease
MTFLPGTIVLALASVAGALAPSAFLLIIARVVQGLGGAAILACGLGLIGQVYPGRALARVTAIWAAALGACVAIGPTLASALAGLGSWMIPYWFSGAAAGLLAIAGRVLLAESRASNPRRIDLAGTLLLEFGMAALLAGLTQSRTGWDQISVCMLLFGGLAMLAGFVAVERRIASPDARPFVIPQARICRRDRGRPCVGCRRPIHYVTHPHAA